MPNPGKKYDFKINQLIELPKDAQFSWIETNSRFDENATGTAI